MLLARLLLCDDLPEDSAGKRQMIAIKDLEKQALILDSLIEI
jgi:hypothetical protein